MKKIGVLLTILVLLVSAPAHSERPGNEDLVNPVTAEFRPSQEMQELLNTFAGNWTVDETFEISASHQGQKRHGTASFRVGPGFSLIEEYKSSGSAGKLNFLAVLWWDPSAKVYRLFTCANDDGCALRGTATWEGNALVNSWQESASGKVATYKDSFLDISASAFRLVSEGSTEGKTIWRVVTQYTRLKSNSRHSP